MAVNKIITGQFPVPTAAELDDSLTLTMPVGSGLEPEAPILDDGYADTSAAGPVDLAIGGSGKVKPMSSAQLRQEIEALPLSKSEKAKLRALLGKKYKGTKAQRELLAVIKGTRQMPPKAQAELLRPFAVNAKSAAATASAELVGTAGWAKATAKERVALAHVFKSAGNGRSALVKLANNPNRLKAKDTAGQTLLSNLDELASGKLNATVAKSASRAKILQGLLAEVAAPRNVDQSVFQTCTVTAMQYELARDEPAEYARILGDLASKGKAKMRGGGELKLQPECLADIPGMGDKRSLAEDIFQSAAMEYGNLADNYQANKDVSVRADGQSYRGLYPAGIPKLLKQLFGREFKDAQITDANRQDILAKLSSYSTGGKNAPVIMSYMTDAKTLHAVNFEKIKDGRVYFRNPYGATTTAVGGKGMDGARVEDAKGGLYSYSIAEFSKRAYSVDAPASLGIGGTATPAGAGARPIQNPNGPIAIGGKDVDEMIGTYAGQLDGLTGQIEKLMGAGELSESQSRQLQWLMMKRSELSMLISQIMSAAHDARKHIIGNVRS